MDGGRVWCRRVSGGPGIPLLCVHGGPGFPHDPLVALGEIGGRDVIFYDQLGCGRSDPCSDDRLLTLPRFVDEIVRLREALDLPDLHLIGTSWGGTVAAAYAAGRPQGLTALILSSPLISTARWTEDALHLRSQLPGDVQEELERHERHGFTGCPEYAAAMLVFYKRHVCRLDPWPESLEACFAAASTDIYNKMWGPSEFHPNGTLLDLDISGDLPRIDVPVLFTCGEHDEARPTTVEAFARSVTGARFEVIGGASHMPMLERPATYVGTIRSFLEDVESAAGRGA